MNNMKYCPKCAHIEYLLKPPQNCKYCNHTLVEVDFTYIELCNKLEQEGHSLNDVFDIFEEKYIINNPEFSEDAKRARIKKEKRKLLELDNYKVVNKVKCPYCQSEDVKKITMVGRAVSVGLLGVASGKIGKQWHCNNCKSDF